VREDVIPADDDRPGTAKPVTEERLDRRQLLVRGGLVAGTATVAGVGGYVVAKEISDSNGSAEAAPAASTSGDGGEFFALDPDYRNLSTFYLAMHPKPVRDAIERHRQKLDANTALYLREAEPAYEEEGRAAAADYLGADPSEVALTDSTTMGLGLVYARLRADPGDEILTTEHDFYATHESLRMRASLDGIEVRKVGLYPVDAPETASTDAIVSAIADGITARTRAVAVTWVHSSSGVKLPLRVIADAVADANDGRDEAARVLLCVDGIHGFGAEDASPVDLGADVFVSGCHKWLMGPRGTGIVWATSSAWERVRPTIPSFAGDAYTAWLFGGLPTEVAPGQLNTPGGFHSFEHRWALAAAFGVHADELGGRAAVGETTHALAARLKDGLAEIGGVTVKTPTDEALSAGLVCADLHAMPAGEAVERLREEHQVIATVTPYATEYLRFGPTVANTEDDVDAAVAAVAAIA
jgi:selenocysteine lyase/cysteine desulfurase